MEDEGARENFRVVRNEEVGWSWDGRVWERRNEEGDGVGMGDWGV